MNDEKDRHSETHWSQASGDGLQRAVPKQFNEMDESASSQAPGNPAMKDVGDAAFHDATNSMDTDRGPVMDAVYNGSVTEGKRMNDAEEIGGERDPNKSTSSRRP